MKVSLLFALVYIVCRPLDLLAVTLAVPDIPSSKLTAIEALELANKRLPKESKLQVVAVEWCQPSKFQPRISDGTQYHFLEAPEEWSWIITLVDMGPDKANNPFPVSIIRVRSDGRTEVPIGTRT